METKITVIEHPAAWGANEHDSSLESFLRLFAINRSPCPEKEWAEKYGTDYEDEKFSMHRFCWCESDDCPLCMGAMPNFEYKPLGFMVSWYKYIGRGMEWNKPLTKDEFRQMMDDCDFLKI